MTLSRIFDWFDEDFEASGGAVAFAARFAPQAHRDWLAEHPSSLDVEFFDYDWSLNDWLR